LKILNQFLHTYYTFLFTLDCKLKFEAFVISQISTGTFQLAHIFMSSIRHYSHWPVWVTNLLVIKAHQELQVFRSFLQ